MGKGENDGYQHFLLFPSMFSKDFLFQGQLKLGLCGRELLWFLDAIRIPTKIFCLTFPFLSAYILGEKD